MFSELINKLNFLDEAEKDLATVNLNPFGDPDIPELNPFGDPDSEGSKFVSVLLKSLYSQVLLNYRSGRNFFKRPTK